MTTPVSILVVEDEAIVAQDLAARLRHLGYPRVEIVGTGEEALTRFAAAPSDLVLMDIRLRGELDGIETAKRLRERTDVPLVYLTAYADPDTLARAGPTRPAGYVLKPFDERDLHGTLEMALWKHQADQALRRSERNFRTLIEGTPDAIGVHRDGRFVYVNRAALELIGLERPEELLGRPLQEVFPPRAHADLAEGLTRLERFGADGAPVEAVVLHRDGTERVVEMSTFALDFDGAPAFVAIGRDLTDRRRMEAQLGLADRMASVGTLAAGVAHEISNPLTYALHNLDRLAEDVPRLTEALEAAVEGGEAADREALLDRADGLAERVRRAVDGCVRVRDIVRDLKTFSRFDDDAPVPLEVAAPLEAALSMAHNELKYRAEVVRELGPTPLVLATEGRLSQVFLNLLVNAAHAIPEGRVRENEVRVRTFAEDDAVVVEVADTGEGIPPEHLGRLFDPFFTTKPAGVGSGLGLSICHNIVTAYGGRIEVESRLGEGSTFRVWLPAAVGATAAPRPVRRPTPPPVAGRVLIVDDEANIGATLRSLLAPAHAAVLAGSGAEAQEILAADAAFDVILCDLMMPDVSGMDLHDWLRARDPELAARMVFMTGGAFTQRARAFLDAVERPWLEKPFRLDRLTKLIAEIILARGRRAAAAG